MTQIYSAPARPVAHAFQEGIYMGNTFSLDKVEHRKCNILSSGSVLLDPPSIREWRQGDDSDAWHAIITTPPFQVETSWTTAYRWAMALPKQLTFLEGAAAKALQAAFIVEHAIRTKRERIHDILIADYEAMQTVIQSAGRLWSSSRNVARQKFGTLDLMRKLYGERLSQEVVADRFLVALKTVQERSQRAQNVVNTAFSSFCEGSDILSPWSPCYSLIEGAKNRWRSASRLEWSARWGRWVETLPPSHKIEWQPRALLKRSKPAPKLTSGNTSIATRISRVSAKPLIC
jgi:hypothetical protein